MFVSHYIATIYGYIMANIQPKVYHRLRSNNVKIFDVLLN